MAGHDKIELKLFDMRSKDILHETGRLGKKNQVPVGLLGKIYKSLQTRLYGKSKNASLLQNVWPISALGLNFNPPEAGKSSMYSCG